MPLEWSGVRAALQATSWKAPSLAPSLPCAVFRSLVSRLLVEDSMPGVGIDVLASLRRVRIRRRDARRGALT